MMTRNAAARPVPVALVVAAMAAFAGCRKDEPKKAVEPAGPALIAAPQGVPEPEPASPTVPSAPWQQGGEVALGPKTDKLVAARTAAIAEADPLAAWWKDVAFVEVPLLPQQAAMPQLDQGTVALLKVQAAHDGTKLALRLQWDDATPDGNVDTSRFSDAVSVELPLKAGAPPTMGAKGLPVQILHWKGLWQKDLDVGYQDVQHMHPHFWSDLYWFTEPGSTHVAPPQFKDPHALQWLIATSAGNPVAVLQRTTPVEELVAEGWGTLTHQPNAVATGRGLWSAGHWAVVFVRPLKSEDPQDVQLAPGQATQLAFAVWDGGKGQVGGRKHWTVWHDAALAP